MNIKHMWRLWAKALGERASECNRESDRVAYIRTAFVILNIVTNCTIIAGIIRHWN